MARLAPLAIALAAIAIAMPAMAQPQPPAPLPGAPTHQGIPGAATATAFPKVTVGGQIFADYSVPLTGAPQAFHVSRAFLTARGQLDATWSGTVQLNPGSLIYTNQAGGRAVDPENVLLQLAFLQADNLIPGTTIQLGQLFVPWTEYAFTYFPYIMLATIPIQGGLQNSLGLGGFNPISGWDRGLKVKGGFGPFSYNMAVINGEGLRGNEGDGQRSYEGVFTYQPVPALDLTVMGRKGNPTGALQADRWGGMVVYHTPAMRLGGETTTLVDVAANGGANFRQLHSAFGVFELPRWLGAPTELIARETLVNAQGLVNGAQWESLVGLGVQPVNGVTLVLDDQIVHNLSGALTSDANVLALHTNVTF
jgi:hypothetical protein